jgi:hypothetical protein
MSMKTIRTIICLTSLITSLGLQTVLGKDAPTSAEQLRSEVESALKAKDARALEELFNWQGVSDNMKTMMSTMVAEMPKREWTAVKLAPLPADFQATNEVNGIRYRPSVPVTGWIVVEFTPKGNAARLPYGKSGDAYYLSCNVEENIPGPITKSKILNIEVMGLADPGTFSGDFVFVQGGKEIKQTIRNRGASFYGDYVKSCTVQKTTGSDDSIQLTITEDGKTVFESGEITNKEPIVYEKK